MKVAVIGSRSLFVRDLSKYLPEGTTEPSAEMISEAAALAEVEAKKLMSATNTQELDEAIALILSGVTE